MEYKLGLIAKDIKNSANPFNYRTYGKDLGLEVSFDVLNVPEDRFEETLEYARKNWQGFHITMPYKHVAMRYMDELDESAVKCDSTNTVVVKDGKLIGYNTDGWGLVKCLAMNGVDVKDKKVVMLGAGGVGTSIAYNLFINGVRHVDVVNIDLKQASDLCLNYDNFDPHLFTYEKLKQVCEGADIFINASVMGQVGYDEFTDLSFLDVLAENAVVFDVNYSNPDSKLVPTAREKGIPGWRGRCLTACQAIGACKLWFGKEPSIDAYNYLVEHYEKMDKKGD
ncbi:MAG: shikimate dehydrogenase [Solobacterium sp.]|nr:shikimate dehydrogenase [Erysipelotrichaceae bacterium]MBR3365460.1 shikimate dehydrogenase [Solobacterium sp.]